jgi:hypothetical protein
VLGQDGMKGHARSLCHLWFATSHLKTRSAGCCEAVLLTSAAGRGLARQVWCMQLSAPVPTLPYVPIAYLCTQRSLHAGAFQGAATMCGWSLKAWAPMWSTPMA